MYLYYRNIAVLAAVRSFPSVNMFWVVFQGEGGPAGPAGPAGARGIPVSSNFYNYSCVKDMMFRKLPF